MGDITLRDILNAKSQGEREPLPGLIAISVDSKLSGALDLLRQFNIQSVPVYGTAGRWIGAGETQVMTLDGKQYLAMISILDILLLIQQAASYEHLKDLTVLRSIGETLESQSLWVLPCSVAWSTVAELFAKGVHRILVAMDANVHIDNLGVIKAAEYQVMTQMDVMRFWWTHIQTSGLLADALKSTAASELMSKNVKMARDSDKVWPTLKDMSSHSLQAIPIVGTQSGKLLGALTLSDMKGFLLNLPDADVGTLGHDFGSTPLSDLVPRLLGPSWMDDWLKQHTVKPTDSLFKVLETLIQGKLHQVWVTTGHQEAPTGVITLSDLMRFLHQNQSKA